jgi:hypothetical protein
MVFSRTSGRLPPVLARALGLVTPLVFALVSGCGSGRVVLPLTIDGAASVATADGRMFSGDEAAVRAIATVMAHKLGLPIPENLTVFVYDSRRHFEQGLIHDGQIVPARAAELGEFAIGVGKRRQLLLNGEGVDRHGREWLRLIAHELTHVSQIELAQGEGRAEQWLAEGMAEWVAFSVLEELGLDTLQHRRAASRAGIHNYAALVAARLDIETLGSPRGFTVRHRRDGSLPTYQLAFLMGDYLIQREGLDKVTGYFRSFSRSLDRHANFETAFGQTLPEFESEILGYLKTVVP